MKMYCKSGVQFFHFLKPFFVVLYGKQFVNESQNKERRPKKHTLQPNNHWKC